MDRKMKLKAKTFISDGYSSYVRIYGPSKGWEMLSPWCKTKKSAKRSAERLATKLGVELEWE